MKAALICLLGFCCMTLLTSCSTVPCNNNTRCGQFRCWQTYFNNSRCSKCILDRCKRVCDACTFNEPKCRACFVCVNYDECPYNPPYDE